MDKKIIVEIHERNGKSLFDLEIPIDITAIELIQALNESMNLGIRADMIADFYLASENPIALLRGDIKLSEYGLHDGSKIYI